MPNPNDGIIQSYGGSTNTSGSATVLTPAFVSGTAAQLTDTTKDYLVYFQIGTGGGTVSIAIGPASSVANAIIASATGVAGAGYTIRVPAGWFLKITVATSTIAAQTAVSC